MKENIHHAHDAHDSQRRRRRRLTLFTRPTDGLLALQDGLPVCVAQDARRARAQAGLLEGEVHLPGAPVRQHVQLVGELAHREPVKPAVGPVRGSIPRC